MKKGSKRIILIIGTRPEAIKLIPVYLAIKKVGGIIPILVSTGQHKQMLEPIFDYFKVKPDVELKIMSKNQSLEMLTARTLQRCSTLFEKEKPELVMVQGDTTSAMASTLAAFYKKIPVAHVEAGLRSFDIFSPYPEEVNRKIISNMASLHFAPTLGAKKNLTSENVNGLIYNVGNPVVDSLYYGLQKLKRVDSRYQKVYGKMLDPYKKMVLITGHRRESFGRGFQSFTEAIKKLAKQFEDVSWIYPVHLNPNVKIPVYQALGNIENVFLIDPVGYDHMIFLMRQSYFIISDSGGIQEEAPALGKPVLVTRETTERPEGVLAGCSKLVGTNKSKIVNAATKLLTDAGAYKKMINSKSLYGDGKSGTRIAIHVQGFLNKNK